jgi:hypothetical protein
VFIITEPVVYVQGKSERFMYECRCDERLKTDVEGSTHLTYTHWVHGLL